MNQMVLLLLAGPAALPPSHADLKTLVIGAAFRSLATFMAIWAILGLSGFVPGFLLVISLLAALVYGVSWAVMKAALIQWFSRADSGLRGRIIAAQVSSYRPYVIVVPLILAVVWLAGVYAEALFMPLSSGAIVVLVGAGIWSQILRSRSLEAAGILMPPAGILALILFKLAEWGILVAVLVLLTILAGAVGISLLDGLGQSLQSGSSLLVPGIQWLSARLAPLDLSI
jgi:hypothetical protein